MWEGGMGRWERGKRALDDYTIIGNWNIKLQFKLYAILLNP